MKKVDKLDFIKIKICSAKDTIKRIKRQARGWRKYLQKTYKERTVI